jgi:hypothetical protein
MDAHFIFETEAFADAADKLSANVNELHGHALADFIGAALRAAGFAASEPWAEDHGWDLSLERDGAKWLIACVVHVEDGMAAHEAHVTIGKMRSLQDKLLGRNMFDPDEAVVAAIRAALSTSPLVRRLEEEHA